MAASPLWQPALAKLHHLPAIRVLYEQVWEREVSEALLKWKLFDGPCGSLASVAMVGEACVGLYAVIPTPLRLDGVREMGAQSVDTMTHPDYRRQNMSVTLAKHCYAEADARGYRLVYGVPNENSYPMFMTKLDWRHVDDMVRFVRPLSAPARVPRLFAPLLDAAISAQARTGQGSRPVAVAPVTRDTRFHVPARGPSAARCRVDMSSDWLAWRYGGEPGGAHECLVVGRPTEPDALIVFDSVADDHEPTGRPLLRISALLGATADDRSEAVRALVRIGAERGARSVFFYTSDPETMALLRRAGFLPRESLPLCYGGLGAGRETLPAAKGEMAMEGGDRD